MLAAPNLQGRLEREREREREREERERERWGKRETETGKEGRSERNCQGAMCTSMQLNFNIHLTEAEHQL